MKRGDTLKFKTEVLKDPSLGDIDKDVVHCDIYQNIADNVRLWLNYKSDKSIWIDTFEYFKDIFGGK